MAWISVHSALKLTSSPVGTTLYQIKAATTQNQTNTDRHGSLSNVDTSSGVEHAEIVVCVCVLFVVSHFKTQLGSLTEI